MKQPLLLSAGLMASLVVVLAQQPVGAVTLVTEVQTLRTSSGVDVVLKISQSDRELAFSEIFMVNSPTRLTVDLKDAQLRLPTGNIFHQDNPCPGIASLTILSEENNHIRILVAGINGAPQGQVSQRNSQGITLSFQPKTDNSANSASNILQPNPKITINGVEVPSPESDRASPVLSGKVELSVGGVSVPLTNSPTPSIRLEKSVRIPRLLLQDVPVLEVLTLLARAADMNVTVTDFDWAGQSQQPIRTAADRGASASVTLAALQNYKISLDIENEPVENIFNYVIQLAGLQAQRVGSTIFVGKSLPREQDNRAILRSIVLNQRSARKVAGYLFSIGIQRSQVSPPMTADNLCFAKKNSLPSWPGLQVLTDEQKNVLTLNGPRQLVESAIAKLRNLYECTSPFQNSTPSKLKKFLMDDESG